jgi:deoxyribodipyrimidine photo-lyase
MRNARIHDRSPSGAIVWFRLDLRLEDHPALVEAIRGGGPVYPLYIWSPEEEKPWAPGAASRWWLHQSLRALAHDLEKKGSRLLIRRGPALETLRAVARETGAGAVFWSRRYEPAAIRRDALIKDALVADGWSVRSFNSALCFEPWTIENKQGRPFQVFTPFWNHCLARPEPPEPAPAPSRIPAPARWPTSVDLDALELEPRIDWAGGLRAAWTPGERGARKRLAEFLDEALAGYEQRRDIPATPGTSRLSPHLHFGEISPRAIWHEVQQQAGLDSAAGLVRGAECHLRELGWREFAHHLLYHFPRTPGQPLRPEFAGFPWRRDSRALNAWQKGRTGYPIVDAGMRELWATGWMHNRVRMIVASFLVKHLLLPWPEGARWFWDTLVDADLANNTLGWQWSAGCGADAAPYFRIFNPVLQGERFDPQGTYVRRWVPELARLPDAYIHKPWLVAPLTAAGAGVGLGRDYPRPLVEHARARARALEALQHVRHPGAAVAAPGA